MWSPILPQMQMQLASCSLFRLAPVWLDGGRLGWVLGAISEVTALQVFVNMYIACIYVHGKCCNEGLTQFMWQAGLDFKPISYHPICACREMQIQINCNLVVCISMMQWFSIWYHSLHYGKCCLCMTTHSTNTQNLTKCIQAIVCSISNCLPCWSPSRLVAASWCYPCPHRGGCRTHKTQQEA